MQWAVHAHGSACALVRQRPETGAKRPFQGSSTTLGTCNSSVSFIPYHLATDDVGGIEWMMSSLKAGISCRLNFGRNKQKKDDTYLLL